MSIKVCVDPGHSGPNPGAVANGYIEKHLNLELAFLLEKELKRCGIRVVLTRRDDKFLSLSARGRIAKKNDCNMMFSIHFNANDKNSRGTETIYSYFGKCIESSKWIAQCVLEETVKLGTRKRGSWTRESGVYAGRNYYGILRYSEPIPGIIAEGLFLDNREDVEFLKDPNFLQNMAIAYAKGICKSYSVDYVPAPTVPKPAELGPFSDWDDVSDYAKASVKDIRALGIMIGDDKGNFNPKQSLSRQDFAVVMMKILKRVQT